MTTQRPFLRIRTGAQSGRCLEIEQPVVLGRDAEFAIDDSRVSRRHARVSIDGDVLVVEDLDSSNGTWVNGRRVERAVLRPGDELTIGATTLETVAPAGRPAASEPTAVAATAPAVPEEQLRPITALFADVVGSTGLGERLDPDEISRLIGDCVSHMSEVVERFGGVVSAYMGDGIAAFFGLDEVSEQDPELAAHAALAIISTVGRYSADVRESWGIADFNVRVGLNSGDAAVGVVGSGNRANVALGDTTNVAARLQSAAEPGTIVVGDETADRLRGRFLLEPLGEVAVKGRRAPVRAWRLLGALDRPAPPEVRRLLGRDAELALIRGAVDDVCAGNGRVLFLIGELGMGKTSLLGQLEAIVGARAVVLQAFCASSPATAPYGPFAAMLRAWLASEEEERVPTVAAKLASRLQSLQLGPATEAGLALLLNLESGNPESADPVAAYVSWLEALAAQRPTVVALDDMHWLEPSSAVLAVQLAELAMRLPLLFVATLRPEQASRGWHVRTSARIAHPSRARETALAPLTDEQARELVADLAPDADAATADDVVRRAEGNPLFVEQLLRARREGAVLASGPGDLRTVATARLLPPALAGVFVGRIDRLPTEARVVAQTAAAVGRTFRRDLLARMLDERTIDAAMPALSEAGIVVEHEPPPDQSWSFTHALLRDAVLSTLVRSRRRQIFNDVAAAFEQAAIEAGEERLELLAYYYARSDDRAKALEYHERAAARALRVGAGAEAAEWLAQARQLAEQLGDETAAARIAARLGGVVTPAPGSP